MIEPSGILDECQLDSAGRSVALFGDNNLRDAIEFGPSGL
jgi:hypothetical protein